MLARKLLILLLSLALFVTPSGAIFLDVGASSYANHSANILVEGYVKADNESGISNINVTGIIGNANVSAATDSSGFFNFNITSPNSTGRHNITLTTNNSITRLIEIYSSNLTSIRFNFTGKKPPFNNGTSFRLNVSYTGITDIEPVARIFSANSDNSSGWLIRNLTPATGNNYIWYNITVPSYADGRYVFVFEEGAGFMVFLAKSNIVVVASTEDSENSTATSFGPGEVMSIKSKVRDQNNPITDATVRAFIKSPNGTVVNISLAHSNTTNGTYEGFFDQGSLPGDYKIDIVAQTSSGKIIKSFSTATVEVFEAELEIVKDFFFDFGSSSAFRAGGPVEFNVLVYNLSDDTILNGSLTPDPNSVNCTATFAAELRNARNGSLLTMPSLTNSENLFLGQNVCKTRFTAPSEDGIYSLTVNATVGKQGDNTSVLATGYFSVQSYIMRPSAVSSLGGGKEFVSFLMPGDNATFEISVRNLSSNGTSVPGNRITDFNVTRIVPLTFTRGTETEITNITIINRIFGSSAENPKIKIAIPEGSTGPHIIEFTATIVDGSVIKGETFYFARFVEGFLFPASFGGGFGVGSEEGGSGGPNAGGNFKCSGQQKFSAKIFDVRTRQAARNVVFNSIVEAREEQTGKDISNQVSIASSTTTNSNGFGNITINFSGSFSGFHFMLINVTTSDGKSDTIPGGFECRTLSFFPNIMPLGASGGFYVSPSTGVNISVSGIKNLETSGNVTNGSVSILKLQNFDPAKGPKFYPGSGNKYPLTNGGAIFNIYPDNFSGLGSKWSNGFNDLVIKVCDNTTVPSTCDTSFGGFQVVAFDAFIDFSLGPSPILVIGEHINFTILTRTNVSASSTSNFTVQIGFPWEGSLVNAPVVNFTHDEDGWDNPSDFNFEKWTMTIEVPSEIRKGGNMVIIKVKNYLNETTDAITFTTASSVSITVPDTEGIFFTTFEVPANVTDTGHMISLIGNYSTNLSYINETYNVYPKSNLTCASNNFTVQRFGPGGGSITYADINVSLFVLDSKTEGVYDTLVINNSNQIAVVDESNRSLEHAGFPGLYLLRVEDCEFVEIVNTTISSTGFGVGFGGQHAVNSNASIPFIIKKSNQPRSGVYVDVFQIIEQEDFGGGRGGFGFTDFLSEASYNVTQAVTDSNGIGFLKLNIAKSGLYSVLWNISDSGSDDIADFSEGIPIEIKSIRVDGGIVTGIHANPMRLLNLTLNDLNSSFLAATVPGSPVYIGTWNESSRGDFIADSFNYFHYIALRNATEDPPFSQILNPLPDFTDVVIDNDNYLNTSCGGGCEGSDGFSPVYFNMSDELGPPDIIGDTLIVAGNKIINSTLIQLIFSPAMSMFDSFISNPSGAQSVGANITIKACAKTFTNPEQPMIGANVSGVITQSFTPGGPPVTEALIVYDPFTSQPTGTVYTGPSGCAVFNVSRSGGWVAGFPNEIKATITTGNLQESAFLGNVFVECTSGCF